MTHTLARVYRPIRWRLAWPPLTELPPVYLCRCGYRASSRQGIYHHANTQRWKDI